MLLAYGAKNFFCFNEGVDVSLRLDQNCPSEISGGRNYTRILGVKGANGSGKTNLLKIVGFLANFCAHSFENKPDADIDIDGFYYDESPSEFYIEFAIDEILYRYELEVTKKEVLREAFFRTVKREVRLFERLGLEIEYSHRDFSFIYRMKLRKNASIISIAHQYNMENLEEAHTFFRYIITNVNFLGMRNVPPNFEVMAAYYLKFPQMFERVKEILIECDLGISDVEITKMREGTDDEYHIAFYTHRVGKKDRLLPHHVESSGTKSLFLHLANYMWALVAGGILVHDEFDVNLHPMILPKLLSLFLNEETNPKNAQLIFTTHDSALLDFLGKYRTYLVNKEGNESYAYRLDELPSELIRNDRPIAPLYEQGKIGGIPKL